MSVLPSKDDNSQEVALHRKLTCFWKDPSVVKGYTAAASLHGHTNHSREGLTFIPKFAARHWPLRFGLAVQGWLAKMKSGAGLNFPRAYWTPPLPPLAAFQLERDQIERSLGLASMVSLTDHDNIEAPMLLRVVPESRRIPVSVEWTVPYKNTVFHLGIHNLPSAEAAGIMAQLAAYTKNPDAEHLRSLLAMLHEIPDALIVLNHPMWDLAGLGKERHIDALTDFTTALGIFVHAFELSGVRNWAENRATLHFAERWNQLTIAGGDRHGAEPNAVLNLTNARSFSEFVHEIRHERRCHILFMPQYAEPFTLRMFQSVLDVVREYPDYPEGSRHWDERVFHPDPKGEMRPLCTLWRKPPAFITLFFAAVRLLESAPVRRALRAALATPEREMHLAGIQSQEAPSQWKNILESRSFRTPTAKSTAWRTPAANLRRTRRNADSPS
jgi:hypothetical protein